MTISIFEVGYAQIGPAFPPLCIFSAHGPGAAGPGFVSGDLENNAIRLEQNIGEDLGSLGSRPLPQLRKDAQQALARKDPKAALNPLAAIVAANPKDAGAWLSYSRAAIDAAGNA
jgi:alpha-2-macroglobulin